MGEWHRDDEAEWFPYLTGCRSATTVQGTEWLPPGDSTAAIALHFEARSMAVNRPREFERWLRVRLPQVDHVFLAGCHSRTSVAGVLRALRESPSCRLEMVAPDSAVIRLLPPTSAH